VLARGVVTFGDKRARGVQNCQQIGDVINGWSQYNLRCLKMNEDSNDLIIFKINHI